MLTRTRCCENGTKMVGWSMWTPEKHVGFHRVWLSNNGDLTLFTIISPSKIGTWNDLINTGIEMHDFRELAREHWDIGILSMNWPNIGLNHTKIYTRIYKNERERERERKQSREREREREREGEGERERERERGKQREREREREAERERERERGKRERERERCRCVCVCVCMQSRAFIPSWTGNWLVVSLFPHLLGEGC